MIDCVCNAVPDRHRGVELEAELATPAWMSVRSLAMGVFGLLTAEYLPASLLVPDLTRGVRQPNRALHL